MQYNKDNVFYKITHKELKSNLILDGEHFISIYDVAPKAPVHVLIIPKGEYVDYYDFVTKATSEEIVAINKGVATLIEMLKLNEGGYKLVSNSGKFGMQEVMHFHFHLMGNTSE